MYNRPTLQTLSFVNVTGNRRAFYIVRADLHNRRITTVNGRIGTMGRERTLKFASRAEASEALDNIISRRFDHGYTQVA